MPGQEPGRMNATTLRALAQDLMPPALWRWVRGRVRRLELPSLEDDYINWLCRVNGGWLDARDGNIAAFNYALERCPPEGALVEIGSFLGLSTNILSYLRRKHHREQQPFFNCDPWCFEGTEQLIGGYFDASSREYRDYARDVFRRNVEVFSQGLLPHSFEKTSDEFFREWRAAAELSDLFARPVKLGGPMSFAYVDGNHSYEGTREDVNNVSEFLLPGGYMLLDDTNAGSPFGCRQVALELLKDKAYEIVAVSPNHLFRRK
jgi:hypothetical protein